MSWTWDPTINVANIIGYILTLTTIGFVVYYNHKHHIQMEKQLKLQNESLITQNEQTKHMFFSDYTKRYQEIILNFPENINDKNFDYGSLDEKVYNKTMRYMRVYFDLCSEEYFLNKKRYIDKEVWEEWKDGMKVAFNNKAFKTAWKKVTEHSIFYKEFKNFVNNELINN